MSSESTLTSYNYGTLTVEDYMEEDCSFLQRKLTELKNQIHAYNNVDKDPTLFDYLSNVESEIRKVETALSRKKTCTQKFINGVKSYFKKGGRTKRSKRSKSRRTRRTRR